MSAELQLPQGHVRAVASAQALYFNSGEHRLFGWLHRPPNDSKVDMGVVICNPFGYEAICSHRGTRAFAEAIAAAGMPALRFDYLGTGDSAEINPNADQIQVWTRDVLAAADELRRRTGVGQVCLLGFRLGALLATLAASESNSVSALITIAPIISGRRYLRELRTTRMAASLGLDPSEPTSDKQDANAGGTEVSGFAFSAATLATLAKVDLSTLQSPPLPHTLVIEGTMLVPSGREHSAEVQERKTRVTLPGLIEMLMTPPQFAQVPKQVIAATVDWLLQLPRQAPAITDRSAGRQNGDFDSAGPANVLTLAGNASAPQIILTEKPVSFGTDALLFGIITQPPAGEIRRRAVFLLNAGAYHHIGASRMYVPMA